MNEQICRACLKEDTKLNFIFDKSYKLLYNLSEILLGTFRIEISHSDELPQYICIDCTEMLVNSHLFYQKYLESVEIRKSKLQILPLKALTADESHQLLNDTKVPDLNLKSDDSWNADDGDLDNFDYLNLDIESEKIVENNSPLMQIHQCIDDAIARNHTNVESEIDTKDKDLMEIQSNIGNYKTVTTRSKQSNETRKSYECNKCGKILTNAAAFQKHKNYHNKEKIKCPICPKHFTHKSNLKRHLIGHSDTILKCDECDKVYEQATALYDHIKLHHASDDYVMECEICGEQAKSLAMFQKHMRKVHKITDNIKPFKCHICCMVFTSKQGMLRHIDNIHENNRQNLRKKDKNFLCNTCGKSFHTNFHLDVHIRSHTGERPHKCEQCDKTFSQISGLKMHTFTHTGERPFACKLCPKKFTQPGHVREHMLTHSEDRPHICTVCNHSFRVKGNLTAHMLIHSGKKPHSCKYCSKRFLQSSKLRQHVTIKHNIVVDS